jgi:hypothetical protein
MSAQLRSGVPAWVLVGALAFGPSAAIAQTITDGDSTFTLPAANTTGATVRTGNTGGTGAILIAGGDTTDQLFQQWWWFRAAGGTREFALSNRTANSATGNTLRLDYSEPEGFRAVLTYVLTDGANSPASANIAAELEIFNVTAATLNLAVFCYLDFDLEGAAGDSAQLLEPGRMGISDAGGFAGQFLGVNANAYQVTTWDALRVLLANGTITDLNNTGLPFVNDDFTGGFQWNVSIPQNGSTVIRAAYALNTTADAGGECPGDFDGNGVRDLQDLATLLSGFGNSAVGDMDGDGDTDLQDLAFLLAVFGAPC